MGYTIDVLVVRCYLADKPWTVLGGATPPPMDDEYMDGAWQWDTTTTARMLG